MSIHDIPIDKEGGLVWYEKTGIIRFRNRLYFAPHLDSDEKRLSVIVAEKLPITLGPSNFNKSRWPNPDFYMTINYGSCLIIRLNAIVPLTIQLCQERWNGVRMRYVDDANTSHKRLQTWMRRILQQRRKLAAAMALHPRLGGGSGLAVLGADLVAVVLSMV